MKSKFSNLKTLQMVLLINTLEIFVIENDNLNLSKNVTVSIFPRARLSKK